MSKKAHIFIQTILIFTFFAFVLLYILGWFRNEWADFVQLVSLPLEIVGFTLAFIEVMVPDLSTDFEEYLDSHKLDITTIKIVIFAMIFGWGLVALGFWDLGLENYLRENIIDNFNPFSQLGDLFVLIFLFIISFLILSLGIRGFVLPFTVSFLNTISDGKAIGSFGLILAYLGVCGEIYQVITMYIEP